jgi:ribosomal protein L37E
MSTTATIKSVEGSAPTNKHNIASNVTNGRSDEYFSSFGINSFIKVTLTEEIEVNTLYLSLYRGKERRTKFLVVDQDNKPLEPHIFVSSGESENNEKFHFKSRKVTSLKVSFLGNLENSNLETLRAKSNVNNLDNSTNNGVTVVSKGAPVLKQNFVNGLSSVGVQSLVHPKSTVAQTQLQDNSSTQNAQFFSVRNVSVLKEELDEKDEEEIDTRVEEIDELDYSCDDDQCCGGSGGKQSKTGCKCDNCGAQDVKLQKGVCPTCGTLADSSVHYKYVTNHFPIAYNSKTGHLEKVEPSKPKEGHKTTSTTGTSKKATKSSTTSTSPAVAKPKDNSSNSKSTNSNNNKKATTETDSNTNKAEPKKAEEKKSSSTSTSPTINNKDKNRKEEEEILGVSGLSFLDK